MTPNRYELEHVLMASANVCVIVILPFYTAMNVLGKEKKEWLKQRAKEPKEWFNLRFSLAVRRGCHFPREKLLLKSAGKACVVKSARVACVEHIFISARWLCPFFGSSERVPLSSSKVSPEELLCGVFCCIVFPVACRRQAGGLPCICRACTASVLLLR
ncbi:unnamed protein product [Prorocentrum cordatum]|uniref:Uncharacterized protein n=1 Tax=Prorocentrum cordatum TaxID=2364126 RepID=A0ABN9T2S6_9DINO|nr:unnamed protein product [Polarella glacialis]